MYETLLVLAPLIHQIGPSKDNSISYNLGLTFVVLAISLINSNDILFTKAL